MLNTHQVDYFKFLRNLASTPNIISQYGLYNLLHNSVDCFSEVAAEIRVLLPAFLMNFSEDHVECASAFLKGVLAPCCDIICKTA